MVEAVVVVGVGKVVQGLALGKQPGLGAAVEEHPQVDVAGEGGGVDGDDHGAVLHSGDVLYLSGDAAGDVEFGAYGDACLADLSVVVDPSGVDCGSAGSDFGVEFWTGL